MIWSSAIHVNINHCDTVHDWWLFRDTFKVSWYDVRNHLRHYKNAHQLNQDLHQAAQGRPIILDAASDPVEHQELIDTIQTANLADIAVTLVNDIDQRHRLTNLNLRYFPKWILVTMAKFHRTDLQLPPTLWQHRTHALSCMNRLVRKHRFYTWFLIQQRSWFKDVYRSFGSFGSCPRNSVGEYVQLDDMNNVLPADCFQWFVENMHQFPITSDPNFDWFNNQHDHLCPAFVDSYANIVTETSVEVFCPTEKTTKCLQTGTLMFPVASADYLSKLAAMGFAVDFEGIDYTWDNLPNWQVRAQLCVQQVDTVFDNLQQIWQQNIPRLQHNQNLFRSLDLFYHCVHDVKDLIKI